MPVKRNKKGQFAKGHKTKDVIEWEQKRLKAMAKNKYSCKLKTLEEKTLAYESYCKWIASGRSKESWCFEHPGIKLTHQTIEKYIREDPEAFPTNLMQEAKAKAQEYWEGEGLSLLKGAYKGGSPEVWKTFMRNKFGWDKDTKVSVTYEPEARRFLAMIEGKNDSE